MTPLTAAGSLKIRPMRRTDIPKVAVLNAELYGHNSKPSRKDLLFFEKNCLGQKRKAHVFVAVLGGSIVGFIHYYDWASFGGKGAVRHIAHLSVEKEYQRQGIGKALVAYIASDAKVKDFIRIDVQALRTERHANLFYKALGFTPGGADKNSYKLVV